MAQPPFAVLPTNRKMPALLPFHTPRCPSASAGQKPRMAEPRTLEVSTQRPGLSDLKWPHTGSRGHYMWGNLPGLPRLGFGVQLGSSGCWSQGTRLQHLSSLGLTVALESLFRLSDTTPFPRLDPQEVRHREKKALPVVETTQSPNN